jgi:hypothetical protein
MTLTLQVEEPGTSNKVAGDSAKMMVKDAATLWTYVSARGSTGSDFAYPTDGTQTETIQKYPTPSVPTDPDPDKKKVVVFVPGYNLCLLCAYVPLSLVLCKD